MQGYSLSMISYGIEICVPSYSHAQHEYPLQNSNGLHTESLHKSTYIRAQFERLQHFGPNLETG